MIKMKYKRVCFWFAIGLLLAGCTTVKPKRHFPQIIAHRGYWNIKSEESSQNSIRALELANQLGVYGSEFDVHLTKDNVPVVYHDRTLYNTKIDIQKTDYNDLKDFTLPNGESIPRLDQYLDKGKELGIMLILELKEHGNTERECEAVQIIVDMVNERNMENQVEYITFSLDAGKEFIRLAPRSRVFYLRSDLSPQKLKDIGFSGLDYSFSVMNDHPEFYADAKKLGLLINVWTVNKIELILEIAEHGADFITTDIPEKAKSAFEENRKKK